MLVKRLEINKTNNYSRVSLNVISQLYYKSKKV
nr:MAG TPA: hypothetical protein [Caudoviricetes sp.]